ncbi:MAG TPA: restriction endonuclease [Clostridia bacterium]|nr:restriction endonuclease [Clostridia bacterium]
MNRSKRIMKLIADITNDPYMTVRYIAKKYGNDIPVVRVEPKLSDYGLCSDIENELKKIDKKFETRVSIIRLSISLSIMIGLFIYVWSSDSFEVGLGSLFASGWFLLIINSFIEPKPPITNLHKQYSKYKKQADSYTFWKQMGKIDYWTNLDGHEFEEVLAALYRRQGYDATVSKQGGDNGIDILLKKNGEIIAVQCKAHKRTIGPTVARDFYGALMHYGYQNGIIASTSGFTYGVHEFVKDKPITLINLNDILKMSDI